MFIGQKKIFKPVMVIFLLAVPAASTEPAFPSGSAQTGGADSSAVRHADAISCEVERIQIECRSLNADSVARKTIVTLLLRDPFDSTRFARWGGRMQREKTDTLRLDQACISMRGDVPARKGIPRGWRRWAEPALVLVTLSGLVYTFYSVRSR